MMVQTQKTYDEVMEIVKNVGFRDRIFILLHKGDGFLLQMQYIEPDVLTGKPAPQHTRKWYISPWATESEIVQTALKCVLTSQEHIGREGFTYRGFKVYGPHLDVQDLMRLVHEGALREQRRNPPGADVGFNTGGPSPNWRLVRHPYRPYDHVDYCTVCEQGKDAPVHEPEEK